LLKLEVIKKQEVKLNLPSSTPESGIGSGLSVEEIKSRFKDGLSKNYFPGTESGNTNSEG